MRNIRFSEQNSSSRIKIAESVSEIVSGQKDARASAGIIASALVAGVEDGAEYDDTDIYEILNAIEDRIGKEIRNRS